MCQAVYKSQVDEATAVSGQREEPTEWVWTLQHLEVGVMRRILQETLEMRPSGWEDLDKP